jgi:hypothetical protein
MARQLEKPSFIDSATDSLELAGKRAVAVVFSNYPADPPPSAEALVKEAAPRGDLSQGNGRRAGARVFNGVEITRIPLKRRRGSYHIAQYGSFVLLAGAILAVPPAGGDTIWCTFTICQTFWYLAHWFRRFSVPK